MKQYLINPSTYEPKVPRETTEHFLIRIGVDISDATIRVNPGKTFYGFKTKEDCKAMASFLIENDIEFETLSVSEGARYPYHIKISE